MSENKTNATEATTQQGQDQSEPEIGGAEDRQQGRMVPVGESIKYRRRAQQAEQRLEELDRRYQQLNEQFARAEAQRDEAQARLAEAQNRAAAERMLAEAGVVDIEAASLLLCRRLDLAGELDTEAIADGVERLLIDKPFLAGGQKATASLPPSTASARAGEPTAAAQLSRAAQRAAGSGGRKEIAEYLRLRRQAANHRNH